MVKPLKCPKCYSQSKQEKKNDGSALCKKCSNVYKPTEVTIKIEQEEPQLFSSEDDQSFFSDNYQPTDEDSEEEVESSSLDVPIKKNMFDESDEEIEKDMKVIIKKTDNKRKSNGKLPTIFSDNIVPKKNKNSGFDLDFSDMEEEAVKSSPIKRKANKKIKKEVESTDDNSTDSESEKLQMYDPKRKTNTIVNKKTKSITRAPLRYNPFIVFNQLTRKKLSIENPYLSNAELSKLVAKAWKSMGEVQKEKFIKEQKEKRDGMVEMQKKNIVKRPAGNGYILYSAKQLPIVKKEYPDIKSINDLSSIIGIRWRGLTQEQRDVYINKAKKERDDWIKANPAEHQLYLDKMISKIKATKAKNKLSQ